MLSYGFYDTKSHFEICCYIQNIINDYERDSTKDDINDSMIERMFMRLSLESIKMNVIEHSIQINERLNKEFVKRSDA